MVLETPPRDSEGTFEMSDNQHMHDRPGSHRSGDRRSRRRRGRRSQPRPYPTRDWAPDRETPHIQTCVAPVAKRLLAVPVEQSICEVQAVSGPLVQDGCPTPRLKRAVWAWTKVGLVVAGTAAALGGGAYVLALGITAAAVAVAGLAEAVVALGCGLLVLGVAALFLGAAVSQK